MTTDELVRLIEQDTARHMWCPDDAQMRTHYPSGCIVTIGSLSSLAGVPRRSIEEAIEDARRERQPIITAGGVRMARTAEEVRSLSGWLWARIRSQRENAETMDSVAEEWEKRERDTPADLTLGLVAA